MGYYLASWTQYDKKKQNKKMALFNLSSHKGAVSYDGYYEK